MEEITRFRGYAGEILLSFVKPGIFFTSIPIFLYWGVVALLFMVLGHQLHPIVALIVIVFAGSYLIGRFSIPATKGQFHEGFFTNHLESGEARDFAIRYIVMTFVWLTPCILLMMGLLKNAMFSLMSPPSLTGTTVGATGLLIIALYLVIILAPVISALVATYTDTVGELFSSDTYFWVFVERRADLLSLLALVMGGIFVFFLVYFLPMAIITFIMMHISYSAGFAVASFFYFCPFMLAPVLVGRACGAFICGGESIYDPLSEEQLANMGVAPSHSSNTRPQHENLAATAASGKFGSSVAEAAKHTIQPAKMQRPKIDSIEGELTSLDDATAKAEYQSSTEPSADETDPCTLFKYAYLALRNGEEVKAYRTASKVIAITLEQASYLEAATCFKLFKAHKNKFELSIPHYKALSRAVANMNDFTDATWLIYQHIVKSNAFDDVSLQKQILQYADEAERAHAYAEAFAVYNFFVSNFGTSSFCQFAQDRANDVKSKLGN